MGGRVVLVGHSYGGIIITASGQRRARQVAGLRCRVCARLALTAYGAAGLSTDRGVAVCQVLELRH
jgi:pimeloyl-ACP methyl ester carboxylesterase